VVVGLANHTALIARDGTERPIADSGAPIRDAQGKPQGAVLVFRDVTDERHAEEAVHRSEERLRLMIASVTDYALYMLDPKGHVVSWNSGAERIKGYRQEEILGQDFARFFTPEEIAAGRPAFELETAAKEGRFEDENWRVRKDGSRFWANVVITPIRDASNRLMGFAKVTRDLTERQMAEDERLRLARAQEAIRLRDEFLSIASHELKTPLTALQLLFRAIREQVEPGDQVLEQKVARAVRIGDRFTQLIEALLDVSRISTGRLTLEFEDFDLVEAAREVTERLRDSATNAGCQLSLSIDSSLPGRWDRLRVEQILTNLISNSIRYAAGTAIRVSTSKDSQTAILQVCDDGPGVPEADLSRIFNRFERAASMRHYGGLGLGLYVARQIAEAHGGTILATNAPGAGACFTVHLPLMESTHAAAPH
jgi:PAS domain S-box-containing protein